jgi:hypothetical protein
MPIPTTTISRITFTATAITATAFIAIITGADAGVPTASAALT